VLFRKDLRQYQVRAIAFLKSLLCAGLFLDMGLGKTVSILTALKDLFDERKIKRVLLVAPLRPAQGVWRQEAKKWAHLRGMTFKLIMGDERARLLALNSTAQIHIINVEQLYWLLHTLKAKYKRKEAWPYDVLVIDESSMFKTPNAKTRFSVLRWHVKKFKRRYIATGTPAPKSLLDLWAQIFILDEGKRLGAQVDRYRSRFFSPVGYMGYGYAPDEGAEEKITELISDIILTMRAEDWLELPEVMEEVVWIDLPPKARKMYSDLEREMFIELSEGSTEALSAASLSSKCWQMANGKIYLEDAKGARITHITHSAKIDALKEIIDGVSGNVLVAYWFKPDLEQLVKAFPKAPNITGVKGKRFDQLQDEWNAGKHPIMFVHPQSGGHGLNLQGGGNCLVFYSMLWGREAYAQVKERIGASRQVGLRDHVMYKYIAAVDTVDEVMLAVQRERQTNERRMIKLLKDYREAQELLR
jgi:SNF2 family DNA or RNA helicase